MKGKFLGNKNPMWRDKDLCYVGYHAWIRKIKHNFGFCETCGKITKKLELSNMKNHEYTRNPNDYNYLCISCHRNKDNPDGLIGKNKIIYIQEKQ